MMQDGAFHTSKQQVLLQLLTFVAHPWGGKSVAAHVNLRHTTAWAHSRLLQCNYEPGGLPLGPPSYIMHLSLNYKPSSEGCPLVEKPPFQSHRGQRVNSIKPCIF